MIKRGNRGQITIFVIVGVLIVGVILFIFLLSTNRITSRGQDFENPESFVDNCIRERSHIVINEMLLGGGFVRSNDTVSFKGKNIVYLCKNVNNFEPCINQRPLYLSQVEKELEREVSDDIEQCFASVEQEFTKKNYEFESSGVKVDAVIKPAIVEITTYTNVSIRKGDFSKTYSRFDTSLQSSLYDVAIVANEIVAQEAQWCYFSNDGFMQLYSDYDIKVNMLEDTTKIYTVEDKRSQEELLMATRGCALPAGLF